MKKFPLPLPAVITDIFTYLLHVPSGRVNTSGSCHFRDVLLTNKLLIRCLCIYENLYYRSTDR